MKKLIVVAYLLVLPFATWQVYSGGILTVYRGTSTDSGIYYRGVPSGYDGKATQPINSPYTPGVSVLQGIVK